jgi:hypothetical protein
MLPRWLKALHSDRLMHMAENMAGYRSDLNPDDEIDRLLLEQELTMQSNLLKEAILEGGEFIGRPSQALDLAIINHSNLVQDKMNENAEGKVKNSIAYESKQSIYNSYFSY